MMLSKVIYQLRRRLAFLRNQSALYGVSVDPSVTIRIDDITGALDVLSAVLAGDIPRNIKWAYKIAREILDIQEIIVDDI